MIGAPGGGEASPAPSRLDRRECPLGKVRDDLHHLREGPFASLPSGTARALVEQVSGGPPAQPVGVGRVWFSLEIGQDQHETRASHTKLGVVLEVALLDANQAHECSVGAPQVP